MPKSNYGKKYICFKCGCKFYNLNKKEAKCPKCGANQKDAPDVNKSSLQFTYAKSTPKRKTKTPEVTDYEPIEVETKLDSGAGEKLFDSDVEDYNDVEEEEEEK